MTRPSQSDRFLSRLFSSYRRHRARVAFRRSVRRDVWFLVHVGVGQR